MSELYILHLERPVWHHAQHYVGYTKIGVWERLDLHRKGRGSKLLRYANQQGIHYWPVVIEQYPSCTEARMRELHLKREGHLSRHCSICQSHGVAV